MTEALPQKPAEIVESEGTIEGRYHVCFNDCGMHVELTDMESGRWIWISRHAWQKVVEAVARVDEECGRQAAEDNRLAEFLNPED